MNGDVKTKIIKRNGEEVTFDLDKMCIRDRLK